MKLIFVLLTIGHLAMDLTAGQSVPGKPINIHVLADSFNIGVQWEPPTETFGTITNYIVSFTILPNNTEFSNIVSGQDNISIIAVGTHIGRLYKIRVSAQNDVGIGQYSDARYIRINCSDTFDIYPNTSIELTSPGYETGETLEEGVICSWTLKTNPLYIIEVEMEDIDLNKNKTSVGENKCLKTNAFVNVEGIGRFCDTSPVLKLLKRSDLNILTVTLKTRLYAGGRGFKLKARSTLRLPGPPRNIHVTTTNHAVIVTWQQPIENTLPVTSYIIRYNVINSRQFYRIPISPEMRRFSLNVQKYEGQLLQVNMSAAIGFHEGEQSKSFFIRAPCLHKSMIPTGHTVNISSPNYPKYYPKSIVCSWEVTSDRDTELYVTFLDFRLEDTSFCSNDYLLFSFKENREPDCARIHTPKTVYTRMSAFNMTFVTDEKMEYEGFLLEISSKEKGGTGTTWSEQTTTIDDVSKDNFDKLSKSTHRVTSPTSSSNKQISLSSNILSTIQSGIFTESNIIGTTNGQSVKANGRFSTAIYYNDGGEIDGVHTNTEQETSPIKDIRTTEIDIKDTPYSRNTLRRHTSEASSVFKSTSEFTRRFDGQSVSSAHTSERTIHATMTTIHSVDFDQVSSSILVGENLTDVTNTSKEIEAVNVEAGPVDVGTIIGCIVAAFVVAGVCLGLHRYRKQKLKMKISYDGSLRYKRGHVELHDIINLPDLKNYETFNVTKIQETSFINNVTTKSVRQSARANYNERRSTCRPRRKHHSFPYSFNKRKVHQDIEKTLSTFKFIEDKDTLETQIRRKQCRNRTYSL